MVADIHAKANNIVNTPLIILRWIVVMAQLLVLLGSEALFDIPIPVHPLYCLVAASFAINIHSMVVQPRRALSEDVVLWYFIFDVLQILGFLFFTGGTENPFCILLLAPLAMAASLLSLYSLCLLIMLTVLGVSAMSISAFPLQWPDPEPVLSPAYLHGVWVALVVAFIFISFVIWRLAMESRRINDALVHTRGILEEKRRMSALGALAAAAVHELGSPLGTIAVVTREMERETHPDDPFAEDIAILREQTEKCKKILADIARDPDRKMEEMVAPIRFDRLLMEIASEHDGGGAARNIACEVICAEPETLPSLTKTPVLEYGLGNLIGNAMSYAREKVIVVATADAQSVHVTISDDGPGFTPGTLQTVGQPYISTRDGGPDHMGLGIFISINLLEGTGAKLRFSNAPKGGAVINVAWIRSVLEASGTEG